MGGIAIRKMTLARVQENNAKVGNSVFTTEPNQYPPTQKPITQLPPQFKKKKKKSNFAEKKKMGIYKQITLK